MRCQLFRSARIGAAVVGSSLWRNNQMFLSRGDFAYNFEDSHSTKVAVFYENSFQFHTGEWMMKRRADYTMKIMVLVTTTGALLVYPSTVF